MLEMEFKESKVNVYIDEGYVMELLSTREQIKEMIDYN